MKAQDKEENAWISFACAALASGKTADKASKLADDMLERYDERFQYSAAVELPKVPEPAITVDTKVTEATAEAVVEAVTEETKAEPKAKPAKKTSKKKTSRSKPKTEAKPEEAPAPAEEKGE